MYYIDENLFKLANAIVIIMCRDYISSVKTIERFNKKKFLSDKDLKKLYKCKQHINEDIEFFNSDRPEWLCGIPGNRILNKLNERLKT